MSVLQQFCGSSSEHCLESLDYTSGTYVCLCFNDQHLPYIDTYKIVWTNIHVIVVPLFWSVHGECTEGISVN